MKNSKSRAVLPKVLNNLPCVFNWMFLVYLVPAFFIIVLTSWFFAPVNVAFFTQFNLIIALFSCVFGIIVIFIFALIRKRKTIKHFINKDKNFHLFCIFWIIVLLVIQFFIVKYILFLPIGDTNDICYNFFSDFSPLDPANAETNVVAIYLQRHPNLWFLSGLFLRINSLIYDSGIAHWFGGLSGQIVSENVAGAFTYLFIEYLDCILVSLSILMIANVVRKITGNCLGIFSLVLSTFFIGISPMIVVPYSDTYGLFFTTLIIFSYVVLNNKYIKIFIIIIASVVGYYVKPTVLAVSFSILTIEGIKLISDKLGNDKGLKASSKKQKIKKIASYVVSIICSLIISFAIVLPIKDIGIKANYDKEFSPVHYFMMGLNKETNGQFYRTDENITAACQTKETQIDTNIKIAMERINEYGIFGMAKHLARKTLTNYGVGSFISPLNMLYVQDSEEINPVVQFIYGVDDSGTSYTDDLTPFNLMSQFLWFFILIGTIITLYNNDKNKYINVMTLSLLMMSVFLLIFESSQRYLFLYSLYFVAVACIGYNSFSIKIRNKNIGFIRL